VFHTNNQGTNMTSIANISKVKYLVDERSFESIFHKERKNENSNMRVFD